MILVTGGRLLPYEFGSSLGSGGQREFFRARDAKLGRVVAVTRSPARHGRGKAVQKERVRQVLSRSELVESFEEATPDRGGWGATVARLRKLP